jgi:serine/threonine protein kinase
MASATRTHGKYVVERVLGEGTYGKVSLAVEQATGQRVAIKSVKPTSQSKTTAGMLSGTTIREALMLRELSHPNIVK